MVQIAQETVFLRIFRRAARLLWGVVPQRYITAWPMRPFGTFIYDHWTRRTLRVQSHYTQFMRNPSLFGLVAHLAATCAGPRSGLRIASIGCSTGAELYSVTAMIRLAAREVRLRAYGVDLSPEVVEIARRGVFWPGRPAVDALYEGGRPEISDRDAAGLLGLLEPREDGSLAVREQFRKDIEWHAADACDPGLSSLIGEQDIVLANNVLGPMDDALAERCLRNLMTLVRPGGYLVIDGVDLDLKTRVLKDSEFTPILDHADAIWADDVSKVGWPWLRWAREPMWKGNPDWTIRNVVVFQRVDDSAAGRNPVLLADEAVSIRYCV